MKIEITPYLYNLTSTKNGIDHQVEPEEYIGYNVSITGDYINCTTKQDVLDKVIKDLKKVTNDLENNKIKSRCLVKK